MAKGHENLKPLNTRSPEEIREITSKGGYASAEVRRKKATMKKTLEMLLETTSKKSGNTYREDSTLGLIKGAIEGKAENYKVILQLLGELEENITGTPSLNINIVDNSDLEKELYKEEQ